MDKILKTNGVNRDDYFNKDEKEMLKDMDYLKSHGYEDDFEKEWWYYDIMSWLNTLSLLNIMNYDHNLLRILIKVLYWNSMLVVPLPS